MLFYDLLEEYLQCLSFNSAKTYKSYINDIKQFISNQELHNITTADIQKYINFKKALNLKATTIYRYYRIIKTIFNYAVANNYIEKNPCDFVVVTRVRYSQVRDVDYSIRYIRKLIKLFKKTNLYYVVLVALHTRNAKNRNT